MDHFYEELKSEFPEYVDLIGEFQRFEIILNSHMSLPEERSTLEELQLDTVKSSNLATVSGTLNIILNNVDKHDPKLYELLHKMSDHYLDKSSELSENVKILSMLEDHVL